MIINNTRIQYLLAKDKVYKVTNIDFGELVIETRKTDLDINDVPENEIFDIRDFKDFHVILHNWRRNIVNFREWVGNKKVE